MASLSRFQKYAALGIGTIGGAFLFYKNVYRHEEGQGQVLTAWTTNFTPSVTWDSNWDRRDPSSMVKPMKIKNEEDENKYNEKIESRKSKATRHLILVRHGQYNLQGTTDSERVLTELGRQQADMTGKRLAELAIPFTTIVRSTMARAQETSKIIEKSLGNIPVEDDSLIIEGAPIPPEPPIGNWRAEKYYYQDGARIEAAFRKYFYRADPSQEKDSYELLVCHGNVIRYFVCRALQFPPEGWLRLSINNGSITWITIRPSGRVSLRVYGESGHMRPEAITST
ncbi:hypothetical protein HCN44_010826 [Aphidius gifuensis]|uniref:Serine/threonine-protein phosphatase PGAM5, mitochondrial n=1 Tax=Aphidius gifuensis TaxID=684658 RepID=A0A834XSH5_APHGI|nr:serine/threonine-protein phosphatase PGAM5, mitochondrial-like [Aphidius gifuensis]XP_044010528.1 serine/threonine-protein phosphatase PGAM5, mitochondrial-like [Aphidius gifuensis]KAF7992006.1 hypothetical protein HCN44_010826 [Aphidius gifuensis]